MNSEYTKVHLFIFIIFYLSLSIIDLHQIPFHITLSFLQASPKKHSPKGPFNYSLPSNGNTTPVTSTSQRFQSCSRGGTKHTGSRHVQRAASGHLNWNPHPSSPVQVPLPPTDYGDPMDSTSNTGGDEGPSSRIAPPELLLPEPDYRSEDNEFETGSRSGDLIRRRISRNRGFNLSNLLANQAQAIVRGSSKGGSQETTEEKRVRRRIGTVMRESLEYVDDTQFRSEVFSTEIPRNLEEKCQNALLELLKLVELVNLNVRKLSTIQEYLRNCNCGTNNCAKCQDFSLSYDSHRSELTRLKDLLSSKIKFLYENCYSGRENKYESEYYTEFFKSLFSELHNEVTNKNRAHARNLLLRCEIMMITDKIMSKQTGCRKCKKKHEVCSKHSYLLTELREIESLKSKNSLIIQSSMNTLSLKISSLPTRLIRQLCELEAEDETFVESQIAVKECMNKLNIKSLGAPRLNNEHLISVKIKGKFKKRSSVGSIAIKSSSSRPGFVGDIHKEETGFGATGETSGKVVKCPGVKISHLSGKGSSRRSTSRKGSSGRTSSHASKRSSGALGEVPGSKDAKNTSSTRTLSTPLQTESAGTSTDHKSGAIPKSKKGNSRT